MTFQYLNFPGATLELFNAAKGAIGQIPPAFPLDATVAVNPFLGQLHESRALTAARLSKTAGIRIFPERSDYAARIADGRIKEGHLAAAASSAGVSVADLRDAAKRATPIDTALPTVADLVAQETGIEWPGFVADRISLWAAVHFDEGQALWPAPKGGVFASWRAFASRDLSTGIAGLPGFAAHVASMPDDPRMALAMACEKLDLAPQSAPLYFHRLLMTLGGWAQLARSKGDRFVPIDHLPLIFDRLADHRCGDSILMAGIAPGEPTLHTGVTLVGATRLVRDHAHEFVAAQLSYERATDSAIRAGRLHLARWNTKVDDRLLLQGGRRASLNTCPAGNAFAV